LDKIITREEAALILYLSISVALFTFGCVSAWFLWYNPLRRVHFGVAVGTSAIALATSLILAGTFYIYGVLKMFWWLPPTPFVMLGLAGGIIYITQEKKWRKIKSRTESIVDVWQEFR